MVAVLMLLAIIALGAAAVVAFMGRAVVAGLGFTGATLALLAYALPGMHFG